MKRARHWATLLLAAGIALALASGLTACGGSADGDSPPTEAPPTLTATPEPPAAPVEPPVPEAPTPANEPASTATATSEPTTAPVEPSPEDPSAATDEAEAMPLLYDTFDTTGAVSTAGQYTFLMPSDDTTSVVTTYEQLRTDATRFRIHTHDTANTSRAGFYDLVEVNDLFEWRVSDTCWARYRVTDVPTPATSATSREFGVKWMTYAYTGCTGAVGPDTAVRLGWSPADFNGLAVTSPIWHGPFNMKPDGWTGPRHVLPTTPHGPPASAQGDSAEETPWPSSDPAVVRTHPLWQEPDVPADWAIGMMWADDADIVSAIYATAEGYPAMEIYIVRNNGRYIPVWPDRSVTVTMIDGHPAVIESFGDIVYLFDETAGIEYIVYGYAPGFAENAAANIAVMRSLLAGAASP